MTEVVAPPAAICALRRLIPLILIFIHLYPGWEFPRLIRVDGKGGTGPDAGNRPRQQDEGAIMAKPKRGRSTAAIDDHVGARIRERRIMLGLTQQQLAELIGVTYQQAHKYERGINRVSAGRLFEIARVLNAPITYFYDGLGEEHAAPGDAASADAARDCPQLRRNPEREAPGGRQPAGARPGRPLSIRSASAVTRGLDPRVSNGRVAPVWPGISPDK